jgi:hypothetical protein
MTHRVQGRPKTSAHHARPSRAAERQAESISFSQPPHRPPAQARDGWCCHSFCRQKAIDSAPVLPELPVLPG